MWLRRTLLYISIAAVAVTTIPVGAQRVGLSDEHGYVGLGLMLRRLNTAGVFMMATAHPDDENNGMLVMLNRGKGMRTVLATATRGDGGQNEIGPELFDALGVLRTEELLAVHRFDGAEQYFTRAIDFGFSFSIEETFEKWGKQEILGDYVRLIRMTRPDVIAGMSPRGTGGGQHHQASALISREAFRLAGDPAQYPDQIREGLRAWQPKKYYYTAGFSFPGAPPPPPGVKTVAVDSAVYDPLLGQTYAELGTEARSMHKCQGMAQLLALPGPSTFHYTLADTSIPGQAEKAEESLFDGLDMTIPGLAQYAESTAPEALTRGLAEIAGEAQRASALFESDGSAASTPALVTGLRAVRDLRRRLPGLTLSDTAQYEIDARLQRKEEEFQQALILASGLRLESLADDGLVVAGQPVKTTVIVADRGPADVAVTHIAFEGLEGEAQECAPGPVKTGGIFRCDTGLRVPASARVTAPYWKRLPNAERDEFEPDAPFGLPFRPTPFRVRLDLTIGGATVMSTLPVQYRYEGNIFSGEKRMELKVVPAFSVRTTPEIAIVPSSLLRSTTAVRAGPRPTARAEREVRVSVTNGTKGAATGDVTIAAPAGWLVSPANVAVTFSREDEAQTVRFTVSPAAGAPLGEYAIKATVAGAGGSFDTGYQVVEYPHIQRRHVLHTAETAIKLVDVRVPGNLTVGYVMGVGDQVPAAIEQLGVKVDLIDPDQLAWGDLSRYDAILTGVRAYERRPDLRANNHRLIEYAEKGGTLIVQYSKFEFNEGQYGPYPAKVSGNRVTDEQSPVQVLAPDHPLFQTPNKIGEAAWQGWVQERGLYFLGERDPRYVDLVQLEDPFEYNKGSKRGVLVEARVGKGRWIYLGLGLWRQLPAGTDGAYQLMANLIALGKSETAKPPATGARR